MRVSAGADGSESANPLPRRDRRPGSKPVGLGVDQALYLVGGDDPYDVVDWFLGMNPAHLGSERVRQDVLLLVGERDSFQPPALARAQARALVAARSIAVRTFTRAEHADQHCQMGNLELACRVLTDWLRAPGPLPASTR